jgi:hypothetical protein
MDRFGTEQGVAAFAPETISTEAAMYLQGLKKSGEVAYDRANEYIRNTPSQIQTRVRTELKELNPVEWRDNKLSRTLFQATGSCFCTI